MIQLPCQQINRHHKCIITIFNFLQILLSILLFAVIGFYASCNSTIYSNVNSTDRCQAITRGYLIYFIIGAILTFVTPIFSLLVLHRQHRLVNYEHITFRVLYFFFIYCLMFNFSVGPILASATQNLQDFINDVNTQFSLNPSNQNLQDLINYLNSFKTISIVNIIMIELILIPSLLAVFLYWESQINRIFERAKEREHEHDLEAKRKKQPRNVSVGVRLQSNEQLKKEDLGEAGINMEHQQNIKIKHSEENVRMKDGSENVRMKHSEENITNTNE